VIDRPGGAEPPDRIPRSWTVAGAGPFGICPRDRWTVAGADPFGICPRNFLKPAEAERSFSVAGAGHARGSPGSARGIAVTAFAILAVS
jgi:hypothetical protein